MWFLELVERNPFFVTVVEIAVCIAIGYELQGLGGSKFEPR
jgi:hypothetical protein